jgi:hypothetical protein
VIVGLADRANVKWTKTGAIIIALFPLAALLQFWMQTYYIPETSRPLVDISTELSPQGRTGAIIHLNAKVTVHNRGAALVNVAGALMRVTAFSPTPREARLCTPADLDKEYCRIAAGLDLSGKNLDSDFRVNPAPIVDRQILYAGDFMNSPNTFLIPGATETFQREIDISPTKVRLARLSVSAVFVTERRIKDTRSCFPPNTS